jgi:hypothetical protein
MAPPTEHQGLKHLSPGVHCTWNPHCQLSSCLPHPLASRHLISCLNCFPCHWYSLSLSMRRFSHCLSAEPRLSFVSGIQTFTITFQRHDNWPLSIQHSLDFNRLIPTSVICCYVAEGRIFFWNFYNSLTIFYSPPAESLKTLLTYSLTSSVISDDMMTLPTAPSLFLASLGPYCQVYVSCSEQWLGEITERPGHSLLKISQCFHYTHIRAKSPCQSIQELDLATSLSLISSTASFLHPLPLFSFTSLPAFQVCSCIQPWDLTFLEWTFPKQPTASLPHIWTVLKLSSHLEDFPPLPLHSELTLLLFSSEAL